MKFIFYQSKKSETKVSLRFFEKQIFIEKKFIVGFIERQMTNS
jgi:hypothetical protein